MKNLSTLTRTCEHCLDTGGSCNGEVVEIVTDLSRELFIRCAPPRGMATAKEQAEKFYSCLPKLLEARGLAMSNVVLERVFFRNLAADQTAFRVAQHAAYRAAGVPVGREPATSCIEQPPCDPQQALELQVYAIAAASRKVVAVDIVPIDVPETQGRIISIDGRRHLYVTNIHGWEVGTLSSNVPFSEQADRMFARGEQILRSLGVSFGDVIRTWCYLDDIDRDYDAFNRSRNEFFEKTQVSRLPASTGIRAGLSPAAARCSMDLYAVLDPDGVRIEIMKTPTLNEASEYGAAFSRGMHVGLRDKQVLYVSGTASVDECGRTVHVDDVRHQVERMLLNVRELLRPYGARMADVVQTITYLKRREYLEVLRAIWEEQGLGGTPATFVEAAVCRPNLLCEIEAIAIVPTPMGGRIAVSDTVGGGWGE
jgi:enamine deaminase RidA (YjgF/YER057c/UK114 family)